MMWRYIWLVLSFLAASAGLLIIIVMTFLKVTSTPPNILIMKSEKSYWDPKKKKRLPFPSISDSATVDVTVVVPAYNEEERLEETKMLDEVIEFFVKKKKKEPKFTYEVIVVDDGSKDATSQVALTYSEKYGTDCVRVCTLEQNRGKGGAVRVGMLQGRGKLLLFADADGATKFADFAKLEKEMKKINTRPDGMAVVCGSRSHLEKESIAERSIFRTILMMGFHVMVWVFCVKSIKDTQCGFKLFTRSAAALLFHNMHVDKWAFDVELLHIAEKLNMPISEVVVHWQEVDGSKLSPLAASLQMGRDIVFIRLRYMFGIWTMDWKSKSQ